MLLKGVFLSTWRMVSCLMDSVPPTPLLAQPIGARSSGCGRWARVRLRTLLLPFCRSCSSVIQSLMVKNNLIFLLWHQGRLSSNQAPPDSTSHSWTLKTTWMES